MALKVAFAVHTPGQAHLWSNIIKKLASDGHEVLVISRGGGITERILSSYGIDYTTYGRTGRNIYIKLLKLPSHFVSAFRLIRRFHPDIIVGVGLLEAHSAALLGKPCIIFEDTELTPTLERKQWLLTADCIVSPSCFQRNLGKKHVLVNSYKELAYLHPSRFRPDPSIFNELGLKEGERYALVRFNSFEAMHDIKVRGFSTEDKHRAVREISRFAKVFVSSEGALAGDLEAYRLPTAPHRIHHVLNYAQMILSDSGTMVSEAAVLGTPGIICESIGGDFGNHVELQNIYELSYVITSPPKAIDEAVELIQQPDLKGLWSNKRQKLLAEKIDLSAFFVDLIENYYERLPVLREATKKRLLSAR